VTLLATCQVTLARPVLQSFTYTVPDNLAQSVLPGIRVRVPFGQRREIGLVESVDLSTESSSQSGNRPSLREVIEVLDAEPLLDAALLHLCRWTADYYVAPIGLVHRAALPPGSLSSRSRAGTNPKKHQVIRLTAELPTLLERDRAFGPARRQREAFEVIEGLGGSAALSHLDTGLGFSRSVIHGLRDRGLAEIAEEIVERDPFEIDDPVEAPPTSLTQDQQRVLGGLIDQLTKVNPNPGIALLRGVTGSGKTVIYMRLIQAAIAAGRTALVLVPEIGLTPQTVARFRAVFGDGIAVLHSGLSTGERHDAWRALRDGRKRVAIGTRSAVFAPLPELGLPELGVIVIDEEHDGSYKQSETPRYHARALAAMRARTEGALLVLGSATPSLESWHNALEGRYQTHSRDATNCTNWRIEPPDTSSLWSALLIDGTGKPRVSVRYCQKSFTKRSKLACVRIGKPCCY